MGSSTDRMMAATAPSARAIPHGNCPAASMRLRAMATDICVAARRFRGCLPRRSDPAMFHDRPSFWFLRTMLLVIFELMRFDVVQRGRHIISSELETGPGPVQQAQHLLVDGAVVDEGRGHVPEAGDHAEVRAVLAAVGGEAMERANRRLRVVVPSAQTAR